MDPTTEHPLRRRFGPRAKGVLTDVFIDRIDRVAAGANPHARIVLMKSRDGGQEQTTMTKSQEYAAADLDTRIAMLTKAGVSEDQALKIAAKGAKLPEQVEQQVTKGDTAGMTLREACQAGLSNRAALVMKGSSLSLDSNEAMEAVLKSEPGQLLYSWARLPEATLEVEAGLNALARKHPQHADELARLSALVL